MVVELKRRCGQISTDSDQSSQGQLLFSRFRFSVCLSTPWHSTSILAMSTQSLELPSMSTESLRYAFLRKGDIGNLIELLSGWGEILFYELMIWLCREWRGNKMPWGGNRPHWALPPRSRLHMTYIQHLLKPAGQDSREKQGYVGESVSSISQEKHGTNPRSV